MNELTIKTPQIELFDKNGELDDIAVEKLIFFDAECKRLEKALKEVKGKLKDYMEENGMKQRKTETGTITLIESSEDVRFSQKDFKADYPDLYNKYSKLSPKASSIRIKAI
ncbi:hypothetical protein HMPREF1635_02030 [Clostridiales bacterium S5-A14a]|nr:hypothetical protein HMPREF1635_02030 [Clostridiales bacterium S5-A14a]